MHYLPGCGVERDPDRGCCHMENPNYSIPGPGPQLFKSKPCTSVGDNMEQSPWQPESTEGRGQSWAGGEDRMGRLLKTPHMCLAMAAAAMAPGACVPGAGRNSQGEDISLL